MSNFIRNILALTIAICLIVFVFGSAVWGTTRYIDQNYGDGVAGMIFMLVCGVGFTTIIFTFSNFQTNRTHQSAGDDITDFARNMGKAQVEQVRLIRDLERREREQLSHENKIALIDHRTNDKREYREWMRRQQLLEARQVEEKAEEEKAIRDQWWTIDGEYSETILE